MRLFEKISKSEKMYSENEKLEVILNKDIIKSYFEVDEFNILTFMDPDGDEYIIVDIGEAVLCSLPKYEMRNIKIEEI